MSSSHPLTPTLSLGEREKRRAPLRKGLLRLLTPLVPPLLSGVLRLVARTVCIQYLDTYEFFRRWDAGERLIVAFWHNRAVMMPVAGQGRKLCILNSQSRDGEIATRALARWGIRSVRGSATRGGAGGFMQLVNAYRHAGYSLVVVPDGPRGPRCIVKPGVIHLSRATGATIFPVTYAATRTRQLRSWDRLIIPLPFSRIVFIAAEPLTVPRHASNEEVEALRRQLEARLNAVTAAADAYVRT